MTQVMLADTGLPAPQRERVEVMHGAGLTMRALVDDLLDVAKIENGRLTLEEAPSTSPRRSTARPACSRIRRRSRDRLCPRPGRLPGDGGRGLRANSSDRLQPLVQCPEIHEHRRGPAGRPADGGRRRGAGDR
ncbi:hypothetical protein P0F65_21340 [Sphingomonas sp. I4]